MKKILILSFILLASCSLNKIVQHHGVHNLEKKQAKLKINETNRNDIFELIGPPSTKSTFDKDMWIYIERVTTSSKVLKLGKKELITNNVLILEINSKGILSQKIFLDKEKMNNIKFTDDFIELSATKKGYVYDFLRTLRKKMNDPLGKK